MSYLFSQLTGTPKKAPLSSVQDLKGKTSVLCLPYSYWAVKAELSIEIKTSKRTSLDEILGELMKGCFLDYHNKKQEKGADKSYLQAELRDQITFLYLYLWLGKQLPGAVKLSRSGLRRNKGTTRCYQLTNPHIVVLKTISFPLKELEIDKLEKQVFVLRQDEVESEIILKLSGFSIRNFKQRLMNKFCADNPHIAVSPTITAQAFSNIDQYEIDPPLARKVKKLLFGEKN